MGRLKIAWVPQAVTLEGTLVKPLQSSPQKVPLILSGGFINHMLTLEHLWAAYLKFLHWNSQGFVQ